jgi:hypothetical protein
MTISELRRIGGMTPEERRRLAIQAAVDVAEELGIDVERPRVLKDSNNTLVHLAPAAMVAKVGTSHFREAKLESLERELAVATYLVGRDAPVVAPAREVVPGPHSRKGLTLTLWQYAQPVASDEPERGEIGAALKAVHSALAGFPGPLPPFSLELEDARRLLRPDRSPALAHADRSFLHSVLDEVLGAMPALVAHARLLHGSPHSGNWVRTAQHPLLLDFETACRGPLEWDLAALDDATLNLFPDVDHELIVLLRRMRSACVAAKCWTEPTRAPEVFEAAHVHLKLLRGEPLD